MGFKFLLSSDLKLGRYMPCETLGQILLDRAEKGVQVLIQVQVGVENGYILDC